MTSNDTLRAFLSHTHWHPPFPHLRPPGHTHADLSAKPSESGLVSTHLGHTKFNRIVRSLQSAFLRLRVARTTGRRRRGTRVYWYPASIQVGGVCVCEEKRRDGSIGFITSPIRPPPVVTILFLLFFLGAGEFGALPPEGRPIAAAPDLCLLFASSSVFLDGSHSAWNSNAKDLGTSSVPRTSDSVTGKQCFQGG